MLMIVDDVNDSCEHVLERTIVSPFSMQKYTYTPYGPDSLMLQYPATRKNYAYFAQIAVGL